MSRQARRLGTQTDGSNVYEMDPWKDDRCRDFIALNTIQRLRSYHSDAALPIEPVNAARAKNLHLLPKAEPDERICTSDEGCAVDVARIIFFGPAAFVSKTSAGRMTASPHLTSHSNSRGDTDNAEETPRTSVVIGGGNDEGRAKTVLAVDGFKRPRELTGEFDAGATPLKQTAVETGGGTPSPQLPERAPFLTSGGREDMALGKKSSCETCGGPGQVRFSCAVVDAIVAYYQSLLTRGVVLDRFSSKDLAFSWWVVCRNMDVEVLRNNMGTSRRDTLLISLRHFYYELLSNFHPKKSVSPGFAAACLSPTRQKGEEGSSESEGDGRNGGDSTAGRKTTRPRKAEAVDDTTEEDEGEEERPRPRSRLNPTRSSPPTSARNRRRVQRVGENSGFEGSNNSVPSATAASGDLTETPGLGTRPHAVPRQATERARELTRQVRDPASNAGSTTSATAATIAKVDEKGAVPKGEAAGVAVVPKRSRPSRTANLAEVWRPIRSTRRRSVQINNSTDTEPNGTFVVGSEHHSRSASCDTIVERIRERMANDPAYAALFSAFPNIGKAVQIDRQLQNGGEGQDDAEVFYGMHPSLVQLLRYHHMSPSTPQIPLINFDEEDTRNEEQRQSRPLSSKQEEPQVDSGIVRTNQGDTMQLDAEERKRTEEVGGTNSSPPIHCAPSFSELTYAQRCLLAWEASLLLDTQQPQPTRKRSTVKGEQKGANGSLGMRQQRNYYDYWRDQRVPDASL